MPTWQLNTQIFQHSGSAPIQTHESHHVLLINGAEIHSYLGGSDASHPCGMRWRKTLIIVYLSGINFKHNDDVPGMRPAGNIWLTDWLIGWMLELRVYKLWATGSNTTPLRAIQQQHVFLGQFPLSFSTIGSSLAVSKHVCIHRRLEPICPFLCQVIRSLRPGTRKNGSLV